MNYFEVLKSEMKQLVRCVTWLETQDIASTPEGQAVLKMLKTKKITLAETMRQIERDEQWVQKRKNHVIDQ